MLSEFLYAVRGSEKPFRGKYYASYRKKKLEMIFCLRSHTTQQSHPIIEFREVGRRYSVKLKPVFLFSGYSARTEHR